MVMSSAWKKAIQGYKQVFGKEPNLNNFEQRMTFQKTVYVLKLFGIQFDKISFTWFHRGPYSFEIGGLHPSVTSADDGLTEKEAQLIKDHKKELLEFLQKPDNAELYASVAFLHYDEKLDEEKTIHKMSLMKPWFAAEQVKDARKKVLEFFEQK